MKDDRPAADSVKRGRASNLAALRAVVAAYLLYLGVSILWDQLRGKGGLSPLIGWGAGILFIGSALAFGWYTWKRWHLEQEASEKARQEETGPDS